METSRLERVAFEHLFDLGTLYAPMLESFAHYDSESYGVARKNEASR